MSGSKIMRDPDTVSEPDRTRDPIPASEPKEKRDPGHKSELGRWRNPNTVATASKNNLT
jgi:hypothetical protein